jgi:hypothetical protein
MEVYGTTTTIDSEKAESIRAQARLEAGPSRFAPAVLAFATNFLLHCISEIPSHRSCCVQFLI